MLIEAPICPSCGHNADQAAMDRLDADAFLHRPAVECTACVCEARLNEARSIAIAVARRLWC